MKFEIIVFKSDDVLIHYSIIQFRRIQYNKIIKSPYLEIGPSATILKYRNQNIYQSVISNIIDKYGSNVFAIVDSKNNASKHVFEKFGHKSIKINKQKLIFSTYSFCT